MRFVFLVILMTIAMTGLILWATKPEVLVAQYHQIASPFENHFAEKRAAVWQEAKEQAWRKWKAQLSQPNDCAHPATSLRSLECKNELQMQFDSFDREWNKKIAGGWQPDSVN
ncbi:MAG: hypothetical protein HZB47_15330 [Nitrosomonadales bacterium]|nr:hypothetical protein [Nitrosomonadales bacterium]